MRQSTVDAVNDLGGTPHWWNCRAANGPTGSGIIVTVPNQDRHVDWSFLSLQRPSIILATTAYVGTRDMVSQNQTNHPAGRLLALCILTYRLLPLLPHGSILVPLFPSRPPSRRLAVRSYGRPTCRRTTDELRPAGLVWPTTSLSLAQEDCLVASPPVHQTTRTRPLCATSADVDCDCPLPAGAVVIAFPVPLCDSWLRQHSSLRGNSGRR